MRKVKKDLNSWHIVFYFQVANLIGCPPLMLGQNLWETKPRVVYQFELQSVLLLIFISFVTVVGNYSINKTLQHEKAARATAYYNMELFYTFIFDITVMKATFSVSELVGVSLIVLGNLYMYFINSFNPEEEEEGAH